MTTPVHVLPWRHDLIGLLFQLALWVLVFGGRVVCKGCQRAVPLTGLLVPLPLDDAVRLQHHRPV
ncbi:MAG: hypothetical protein JWN88_1221 [Frankiales bacterium]|nr:hypothetical protein [Frankiales bacterium]